MTEAEPELNYLARAELSNVKRLREFFNIISDFQQIHSEFTTKCQQSSIAIHYFLNLYQPRNGNSETSNISHVFANVRVLLHRCTIYSGTSVTLLVMISIIISRLIPYGKKNLYVNFSFKEKERDASKSNNIPMSSLMSAFVKICSIEKQYFSLSFLVPRRFLMKDTALQSGYAAILNHDLKVI